MTSFFVLLLLGSLSASLGMRVLSRLVTHSLTYSLTHSLTYSLTQAAIGTGLSIMLPSFAAYANQEVGSIPTTGLVFKDYLKGALVLITLY